MVLPLARIVNPAVRDHRLSRSTPPRLSDAEARGLSGKSTEERAGAGLPSIPSASGRRPIWWTRCETDRADICDHDFPLREVLYHQPRQPDRCRGGADRRSPRSPPTGRGARARCVPYARYGETVESVTAPDPVDWTCGHHDVTANGLRCRTDPAPRRRVATPLDCALWDLEAKRAGRAGLGSRRLSRAGRHGAGARDHRLSPCLWPSRTRCAREATGQCPPAAPEDQAGRGGRYRASARPCAEGAPEARIIVDANEGWDRRPPMPRIAPVDAGTGGRDGRAAAARRCDDAALAEHGPPPARLRRREPATTAPRCPRLAGKYDMVNIKLDKTGGLTEALALKAEAAREAGFEASWWAA